MVICGRWDFVKRKRVELESTVCNMMCRVVACCFVGMSDSLLRSLVVKWLRGFADVKVTLRIYWGCRK